jgi:hypothetical protein
MDGWPVWLASMSRRDRFGRIVPTEKWSSAQMADAEDQLSTLLEGVGDPLRERCFRMCITLCRHRALSVAEHGSLPAEWHAAPAVDLAGAPVELLWSKGIPTSLAAQPCWFPERVRVGDPLAGLYVPMDCGACDTCKARLKVRTGAVA